MQPSMSEPNVGPVAPRDEVGPLEELRGDTVEHAGGKGANLSELIAAGSIVAREFGIPAVLGTGEASRRIHHGHSITVDGDQGLVLLEPST